MLLAGHLTDSLGPAVGLALGLCAGIAVSIHIADLSRKARVLAWSLLGVGFAIGLTVAVTVASTTPTTSFAGVVNDPNVTSRALYLDLSSQLFLASPIFGNGLGTFASLGAADLYPHNIVAEIAGELGMAGLALLFAWFLLALRAAARSPLLMSLVVATAAFSLFSGSIAGNAEFWIFTGIAVAMTPLREAAGRRVDAPAVTVAAR